MINMCFHNLYRNTSKRQIGVQPPTHVPTRAPTQTVFYYRNHMRSIWQKILAPAPRRPAGIRCAMELMSRCVILMVLAGAAGQLVFPQGDRVSRWAWADDSWVYATATLHSWLSDIPETLSYCWNYLTWAATSEVYFFVLQHYCCSLENSWFNYRVIVSCSF